MLKKMWDREQDTAGKGASCSIVRHQQAIGHYQKILEATTQCIT